MAKEEQEEPSQKSNEVVQIDLPPGVKLLRTLEGHDHRIFSLAFDPGSGTLASGSADNTVRLWDAQSGQLLRTLEGHTEEVGSLAFNPQSGTLASASDDGTVKLWEVHNGREVCTLEAHSGGVLSTVFDPQGEMLASGGRDSKVKVWHPQSGKLIRTIEGHELQVNSVALDPQGVVVASGSADRTVKLWEARTGVLLRTLKGHRSVIDSVSFDPSGEVLASAGADNTVQLWETRSGKLLRTLEGHTDIVDLAVFSPDGRLFASKGRDQSIRLWNCETWETVAVIPELTYRDWIPALTFHPSMPLLVSAGTHSGVSMNERSKLIHLWELDYNLLLGKRGGQSAATSAVHHTTGKIVLVGDHSVGKSALGFRLIHGRFETQKSTHGQQFWVFPELGKRRADGTECEAVLWDFAGQPDYRLVHALFVDNADLALVLFDSSNLSDPLHGVTFWLKQLQSGQSRCPTILVAAQADRGTCSLTPEELRAFSEKHGIVGPIAISAATGLGIEELVEQMKLLIPWDEKPATVTTTTFKRIKDYALGLKEREPDGEIIVTSEELRRRLQATDGNWQFSDDEMLTAIGHLEKYGYVKYLRTSKGDLRILLQPERLNNLGSSFVLEARRNPKGLGALEEKRLLSGEYDFPELKDLTKAQRDVLLDSAALLFLEHNVCFRETDPLRMEPYLVFPELINLKKPQEEEAATEDGVAYTVSGPTENVFASLVVLLGKTHTFTHTAQWLNNARYEMGEGLVCGFRKEAERDGELDFVLCFAPRVGAPARTLFQGLFESFLARRNLNVLRYEPVRCTNAECGRLLERTVVRQKLQEGRTFAFCNDCGAKLTLPAMAEAIQWTRDVPAEVEAQRRAAEQRTPFEQAVFRLRAYIAEQKITPPECFISYAWGVSGHERWVEKRLATDLQKAGLTVLLDRWDNAQIGSSVPRFVERVRKSQRVVVVGTPLYRKKYENGDPMRGYVVAAEGDLIGKRMIGTEADKLSVLPLVLAGTDETSLPDLLLGRVYADFRDESVYFLTAFDLILSLYQLPPNHPAVADLRDSLGGPEIR